MIVGYGTPGHARKHPGCFSDRQCRLPIRHSVRRWYIGSNGLVLDGRRPQHTAVWNCLRCCGQLGFGCAEVLPIYISSVCITVKFLSTNFNRRTIKSRKWVDCGWDIEFTCIPWKPKKPDITGILGIGGQAGTRWKISVLVHTRKVESSNLPAATIKHRNFWIAVFFCSKVDEIGCDTKTMGKEWNLIGGAKRCCLLEWSKIWIQWMENTFRRGDPFFEIDSQRTFLYL